MRQGQQRGMEFAGGAGSVFRSLESVARAKLFKPLNTQVALQCQPDVTLIWSFLKMPSTARNPKREFSGFVICSFSSSLAVVTWKHLPSVTCEVPPASGLGADSLDRIARVDR